MNTYLMYGGLFVAMCGISALAVVVNNALADAKKRKWRMDTNRVLIGNLETTQKELKALTAELEAEVDENTDTLEGRLSMFNATAERLNNFYIKIVENEQNIADLVRDFEERITALEAMIHSKVNAAIESSDLKDAALEQMIHDKINAVLAEVKANDAEIESTVTGLKTTATQLAAIAADIDARDEELNDSLASLKELSTKVDVNEVSIDVLEDAYGKTFVKFATALKELRDDLNASIKPKPNKKPSKTKK